MKKSKKPKITANPFAQDDWDEKSLMDMWKIISDIARTEYKINFYEPAFEVVTFEEMLHIYSTSFPIMFHHWTFGKKFEELYRQYKNNQQSIAYEVIFNTDPALCYLLETNTVPMQALVMGHAAVGHSAFFRNNEFFRQNTNPRTIISFMKNLRTFVEECEREYGQERVTEILDVCTVFQSYAIDKTDTIELTKAEKEKKRITRLQEQEKDMEVDHLELNTTDNAEQTVNNRLREENILKFIGKHSPALKSWERELILKYCDVQQYFYPQIFTKMMNEGYASFWHYTIMNRLHELGYLSEGAVIEFLHSHTDVLTQHDHDSNYYHGFNPYKLGFSLFSEIRRICENPDDEDKRLFPHLVGKNWIDEIHFAMENFKDESFILQYLTPKIVRELKLFRYINDTDKSYYEISDIHTDEDFKAIRKSLSQHYNWFNHEPLIYIEGADYKKTRTLYLVFQELNEQKHDYHSLDRSLDMLKKLWPYPISFKLQTIEGQTWRNKI